MKNEVRITQLALPLETAKKGEKNWIVSIEVLPNGHIKKTLKKTPKREE